MENNNLQLNPHTSDAVEIFWHDESNHRLGYSFIASIYAGRAKKYLDLAKSISEKPSQCLSEARKLFKKEVKLYRIQRNVSGSAFMTAQIFLKWSSPKQVGNEIYAEGLKARAKMFLTMNNPKEALLDLSNALGLDPKNPGIYRQFSAVYQMLADEYEKAAKGFSNSIVNEEGKLEGLKSPST